MRPPMTIVEILKAKQANLRRAVQQADVDVLVLERDLALARERRTATSAALQQVTETLADLAGVGAGAGQPPV